MACGKPKWHANSIDESCGALSQKDGFTPVYRCDLQPDHKGKHHVCGGNWTKEWL